MDIEVLNDLYNRAKSLGYTKSRNDFSVLITQDPKVFIDNYQYIKSQGYTKSQDDFKELIGIDVKKKDISKPVGDGKVITDSTTEQVQAQDILSALQPGKPEDTPIPLRPEEQEEVAIEEAPMQPIGFDPKTGVPLSGPVDTEFKFDETQEAPIKEKEFEYVDDEIKEQIKKRLIKTPGLESFKEEDVEVLESKFPNLYYEALDVVKSEYKAIEAYEDLSDDIKKQIEPAVLKQGDKVIGIDFSVLSKNNIESLIKEAKNQESVKDILDNYISEEKIAYKAAGIKGNELVEEIKDIDKQIEYVKSRGFGLEEIDKLIIESNKKKAEYQNLYNYSSEQSVLLNSAEIAKQNVEMNPFISGGASALETVLTLGVQSLPVMGSTLLNVGVTAGLPVAAQSSVRVFSSEKEKEWMEWSLEKKKEIEEFIPTDFDDTKANFVGNVVGQIGFVVGSSVLGGTPLAIAAGYTMSAGEMYEEAVNNGLSHDDAMNLSIAYGTISAPLEILGARKGIEALAGKNLRKKVIDEILKKGAKGFTKEVAEETVKVSLTPVLKATAFEAGEEGLQEGAQYLISKGLAETYNALKDEDKDEFIKTKLMSFDFAKELVTNVVLGAAGGAIGGASLNLLGGNVFVGSNYKAMEDMFLDSKQMAKVNDQLTAYRKNGTIKTDEELQAAREQVGIIQSAAAEVSNATKTRPDKVGSVQQKRLFELTAERLSIQKEIEGVNTPSLVADRKQRIEELDQEISDVITGKITTEEAPEVKVEEEVTEEVAPEEEIEFSTAFNQQDATAEITVGKEKNQWGDAGFFREKIENAGDILRELSSRGKNPDPEYILEKITKLKDWVSKNKEGFEKIPEDIKSLEDFSKSNLKSTDAIDSWDYSNKFYNDILTKTINEYKAIDTYTEEQKIARDLVVDLLSNNIGELESKISTIENIANKIKEKGELTIVKNISKGLKQEVAPEVKVELEQAKTPGERITTTEEQTLFKGMQAKTKEGKPFSVHKIKKGSFASVDEKLASDYKGDKPLKKFTVPPGTTIDVVKVEDTNQPVSEVRNQEEKLIDDSDAQVVKLITRDARGTIEEQYIIKDDTILETAEDVVEEVAPEVEVTEEVAPELVEDSKIKEAKSKLPQANKNVKRKLGAAVDIGPLLNRLLAVNPTIVPESVFDKYLEILDMLSENAEELKLDKVQEVSTKTEEILNKIEDESAKEPEKEKGKKEESKEEKNRLVKDIKKAASVKNPKFALNEESVFAKYLKKLAKSKAVEELSVNELKTLSRILDNINNGWLSHTAWRYATKLQGITNSNVATDAIAKAKLGFVTNAYNNFKRFIRFTKKGTVQKALESIPKYYIDQALSVGQSTDIFDSVLRGIAEAEQIYNFDLRAINKRITAVENAVLRSFKYDGNKAIESSVKQMIYLLNLEYKSNEGNTQVNPVIDFINETIANKKTDKVEKERLNEIKKEYFDDKKLKEKKLFDSFNEAEKESIKEIQKINAELGSKALYTAGVVRGDRISLLNNYVHHVVIDEKFDGSEVKNVESQIKDFVDSRKPTTKAKSLIQRTGKVTPLNFDIYNSASRGAKYTLMDFYLTEPISTVRETLKRTEDKLKEKGIYDEKSDIFEGIEALLEQDIETTLTNNIASSDLIERVVGEISKVAYQRILLNTKRLAQELLGNTSYIVLKGRKAFKKGLNYFDVMSSETGPEVMRVVGSLQLNRTYQDADINSRFVEKYNNELSGIRGKKSRSKVVNTAAKIHTATTKKLKNFNEKTASVLMSAPDQIMNRPLWFGTFALEFKKESGVDVDFERIAGKSEAYLEKHAEAIEKAKKKADDVSIEAAASEGLFTGISKGKDWKTEKNALKGSAKFLFYNFNNFMNKFLVYEYTSFAKGWRGLIKNGTLSQSEGVALMAAVTSRMYVYSLLANTGMTGLIGLLSNLLGITDEPEEDDEDIRYGAARAGVQTLVNLSQRNFGNATRSLLNWGVEYANENYLDALREGDYNQYKNSIVYNVKPYRDNWIVPFAGPFSPVIKTATLASDAYFPDYEVTEKAAIERRNKEKYVRVPLEILAATGYLPMSNEIIKEVNADIYKDLIKGKKGGVNSSMFDESLFNKSLFKK